MNKEDFYKTLEKPHEDCDGLDLWLRNCYSRNDWKSIFQITGIDFSSFGGELIPMFKIIDPSTVDNIIIPEFE